MGLDITYYTNVRYVSAMPDDAESIDDVAEYTSEGYKLNGDRVFQVYSVDEFPLHAYANRGGFRAGSYSGYNEWRDWLSNTMLGMSAREVWNAAVSRGW